MDIFRTLAVIGILAVASGGMARATHAAVKGPTVQGIGAGCDSDAKLIAAQDFDHTDVSMPVRVTSISTMSVPRDSATHSASRSDAPIAVPLPAAAPAGLLTLGLIGLAGFVRKLRSRMTAPA